MARKQAGQDTTSTTTSRGQGQSSAEQDQRQRKGEAPATDGGGGDADGGGWETVQSRRARRRNSAGPANSHAGGAGSPSRHHEPRSVQGSPGSPRPIVGVSLADYLPPPLIDRQGRRGRGKGGKGGKGARGRRRSSGARGARGGRGRGRRPGPLSIPTPSAAPQRAESPSQYDERAALMSRVVALTKMDPQELTRDRGGITVSLASRHGRDIVCPAGRAAAAHTDAEDDTVTWTFELANASPKARTLLFASVIPPLPDFCVLQGDADTPPEPDAPQKRVRIAPGGVTQVRVRFTPSDVGAYQPMVVFKFVGFSIGRHLPVTVVSDQDLALLATETPSTDTAPADASLASTKARIVIADPSGDDDVWPVPLPPYPLAEDLLDDWQRDQVLLRWAPDITSDNYRARMHNLLYVEEYQGVLDMRRFNLRGVPFALCRSFVVNERTIYLATPHIKLMVEGLAEKRPSLLTRDTATTHLTWTGTAPPPAAFTEALGALGATSLADVAFTGTVVRVEMDHVIIQVPAALTDLMAAVGHTLAPGAAEDTTRGEASPLRFDVDFAVNRTPRRIMHRAIDAVGLGLLYPALTLDGALAPHAVHAQTPGADTLASLPLIDAALSPEQARVVRGCLARDPSVVPQQVLPPCIPSLLFGPFGTGKTRVLVELIHQTLAANPDAHILVCTPSNSAANIYVRALCAAYSPSELFRCYTTHRRLQTVPHDIQRYCAYDQDKGQFVVPEPAQLAQYRVVLSTMVNAGMLHSVGVAPGFFTHIFLDECAQALEVEAIIPLVLGDANTRVVLAGDPKQLGPVIRSPLAHEYGFGVSLMERLAREPLFAYAPDAEQPPAAPTNRLVFELLGNYRSHPSILKLTSQLFYDQRLVSRADPALVSGFRKWNKLSNPDVPCLFVGVEGRDLREDNSPSFFNIIESIVVRNVIRDIVDDGLARPHEIAVVLPYAKQIEKVRLLMRQARLAAVQVGSVDEIQGQEYEVIVVSTVRTSKSWQEYDEQYHLGFLGHPRRLNTLITRARSLLVVVGDPFVTYADPHWRQVLTFCADAGNCVGVPLLAGDDTVVNAAAVAMPDAYTTPVLRSDSTNQQPTPSQPTTFARHPPTTAPAPTPTPATHPSPQHTAPTHPQQPPLGHPPHAHAQQVQAHMQMQMQMQQQAFKNYAHMFQSYLVQESRQLAFLDPASVSMAMQVSQLISYRMQAQMQGRAPAEIKQIEEHIESTYNQIATYYLGIIDECKARGDFIGIARASFLLHCVLSQHNSTPGPNPSPLSPRMSNDGAPPTLNE